MEVLRRLYTARNARASSRRDARAAGRSVAELDIHSTRRALSTGGAREANPLMRPIVNDSAAFLATKAAATAGVIWASEKLWKKNRRAAVILISLVNTAMAVVVANNYRVNR